MIEVPELLVLPPKLNELITKFNDYRYFLLEGGRGSGKTQAIARLILTIADEKSIRVCCGRETQATIEDSVYQVFVDLIRKYSLNWDIKQAKLTHRMTGSEIVFKGFREQGAVNIKGLEGFNILWIDEAQAIKKTTLDVILPTIRKEKSRIIFSMNRYLIEDPVYTYCTNNPNCLCIKINYYDNPYCSEELKKEAELCKNTNEIDYKHIWLGEPLDMSDNMLFSASDVARMKEIEPYEETPKRLRVIGIDFAAQGGDFCVATVLDKASITQWKVLTQIAWQEPNPMSSIGRIVEIINTYRPDYSIIDIGGMGYVVYSRLQELGVRIDMFDGARTQGVPPEYGNARAYGYYELASYIRDSKIIMNSPTCEKQLLTIRFKYRSNGERMIESKDEMRKQGIKSPDHADSLMMSVYEVISRVNEGSIDDEPIINNVIRRTQNRWE